MRIIFSRLIALILTASLIIVVNPSFAVAWDQHPQNYKTHQEINKQAISRFYAIYSNSSKYTSGEIDKTKSYMGPKVVSNSTFEGDHKVTGEALTFEEWLIHGGYSADEPNFWASVRHFYNPVKANGPQQLTDHSIVHGQVYDAISALDWTFAHPDNPYSWMDALAYYKKALEIPVNSQGKETVPGINFRDPPFPLASDKERREIYLGKAFRSLGETMHAFADVTQPAHVRNDSHPLVDPDPLEEVIKDFHVIKYANSPVDPRIGDKIDAAQDAYTIYQEVALYTNKYFYSNDTIYDGPSQVNPANGEKPYSQPQFSDLRPDDNKITYSSQFNALS
ncbi:MAG: hypothetical protein NTZ34_01050 [Chloroflexi bacterium]|nr:hypothetical protein [Chloroflexota bacterium]